ncbi:Aste57867_15587 [Aphanomyces stellatus]|uniref:Aste57867_15587 protein n=1 Tax=Aphanomyces stellatus TaxID=120398 RepID=A0A485L3G4_9STRA|nr:hypothetical protein As57867_015531 [Aphanomyces stellatus]VFT92389.1 Aste57867_15587 [Aphanomyces stellatus]
MKLMFFSRIHQMPNLQHAMKGFVKYIDGAKVQLDSFRCHALILERGPWSGLERLPFRTSRSHRYNFVEGLVRAVQGCHNLNHIHGDVKLDNIMLFVAPSGGTTQYKLINFDNATRVGQPMSKHCTPEYCPPEMAKYILGHTTAPVIADSSYDVWCTAVLILKLYSEGGTLLEFAHLNNDEILEAIATPDFSFQRSLEAVDLPCQITKNLAKCLRVNPANRFKEIRAFDFDVCISNGMTVSGKTVAPLPSKFNHVTIEKENDEVIHSKKEDYEEGIQTTK